MVIPTFKRGADSTFLPGDQAPFGQQTECFAAWNLAEGAGTLAGQAPTFAGAKGR